MVSPRLHPTEMTPTALAPVHPSYQQGTANPDDPIQKIRAYAAKVEDWVDIYSQPLRPHLPAIGRFLIVVTFLEDALRIVTQWGDQNWYLQKCVV
jgi:hypothetical protein